jgi:hypothetical protein
MNAYVVCLWSIYVTPYNSGLGEGEIHQILEYQEAQALKTTINSSELLCKISIIACAHIHLTLKVVYTYYIIANRCILVAIHFYSNYMYRSRKRRKT